MMICKPYNVGFILIKPPWRFGLANLETKVQKIGGGGGGSGIKTLGLGFWRVRKELVRVGVRVI